MRQRLRRHAIVAILVLAGSLVLLASSEPGAFSVDECNHVVAVLSMRAGGYTVPGTAGLTPSSELLFFDPTGRSRRVDRTPVVQVLPPIYPVLALPFALAGWRGLVWLNALALGCAAALLFAWARRRCRDQRAPWLASGTLVFASYVLEYALGVWPHMLSLLLCTFGCYGVSLYLERERSQPWPWRPLLGAGLSLGLAMGVRYQNVAYAAGLALGLGVLAARRVQGLAVFGGGLLPPTLFAALVNRQRIGTFNPWSKGGGYLALGAGRVSLLRDIAEAVWVKVFDASALSAAGLAGQPWWHRQRASGAVMHGDSLKRAWLQSLPWAALPLLAAAAAWWPRRQRAGEGVEAQAASRRTDLRLVFTVSAVVLAAILSFGVRRHDGLSFNQRYFVDLLPLLSLALAQALDGTALGNNRVLLGSIALGGLLGLLVFRLESDDPLRQLLLLRAPLVLAALVAGCWCLRRPQLLQLVLGLSLGLAAVQHLADDVRASQRARAVNAEVAAGLRRTLPAAPSALFAYWGQKDAVGPLLLERDLVVVDPHWDDGRAAPVLLRELLGRGRRVFVQLTGLPPAIARAMLAGLRQGPAQQIWTKGRARTLVEVFVR